MNLLPWLPVVRWRWSTHKNNGDVQVTEVQCTGFSYFLWRSFEWVHLLVSLSMQLVTGLCFPAVNLYYHLYQVRMKGKGTTDTFFLVMGIREEQTLDAVLLLYRFDYYLVLSTRTMHKPSVARQPWVFSFTACCRKPSSHQLRFLFLCWLRQNRNPSRCGLLCAHK